MYMDSWLFLFQSIRDVFVEDYIFILNDWELLYS